MKLDIIGIQAQLRNTRAQRLTDHRRGRKQRENEIFKQTGRSTVESEYKVIGGGYDALDGFVEEVVYANAEVIDKIQGISYEYEGTKNFVKLEKELKIEMLRNRRNNFF